MSALNVRYAAFLRLNPDVERYWRRNGPVNGPKEEGEENGKIA